MEFSTTQYKHCTLIKTSGRIDSNTAPELNKVLNEILETERYKIVFDMEEVNFLSSAGWWVLINTQKACKRYRRGELVLVNVNQQIRNSLDLVGMKDYFKVFDQVTDAVGYF